MKKMLLKPQREIMNSVLAYQDEEWVDEYECEYFDDYYCDDDDYCAYEENAGDCTEHARWGFTNGDYFDLSACV